MKKLLFLILFSTLLIGCEVGYVETVPQEQVVVRTDPPYVGGVWIDNEWRWDGTRYVVVPAHYEHPRGSWTRGTWIKTKRGYHWNRGRWH